MEGKRMRRVAMLAAVVMAACGGPAPTSPVPLPENTTAHPEEGYTLDAQARALLGGCTGTISYSVVEPTGCGSVSASGLWTSPSCAAVTYPITCHVQVAGCGQTDRMAIAIDEAQKSVKLACFITTGTNTCLDPATIPACEPGQASGGQAYTKITYSCHVGWSPGPIPSGACTAAFCQ